MTLRLFAKYHTWMTSYLPNNFIPVTRLKALMGHEMNPRLSRSPSLLISSRVWTSQVRTQFFLLRKSAFKYSAWKRSRLCPFTGLFTEITMWKVDSIGQMTGDNSIVRSTWIHLLLTIFNWSFTRFTIRILSTRLAFYFRLQSTFYT